jgi:hypothetical protein
MPSKNKPGQASKDLGETKRGTVKSCGLGNGVENTVAGCAIRIRADFQGVLIIGILLLAVAAEVVGVFRIPLFTFSSGSPNVVAICLTLGIFGLLLTFYGLSLYCTCLELERDQLRYFCIRGGNQIALKDITHVVERLGTKRTDALYSLLFCNGKDECLLQIPNYPQEFRKSDLIDFLYAIVQRAPNITVNQGVYERLGIDADYNVADPGESDNRRRLS